VSIEHLVVFLLSFAGLVMLYLLARRHFRDWRPALLCCVFFFLTPRFFAQSFYNSRDIPELAFFTASMFTLLRALDLRTWQSMLFHALATALALALRMPAAIIPVLTVGFFVLDGVSRRLGHEPTEWRHSCLLLGTYFLSLCILTVSIWPFLWQQPVAHFIDAYRFMSSLGDPTPWNYIPVWIFVTVPIFYTAFFLIGTFSAAITFCLHPLTALRMRRDELLFLCWFFLPIAAIILSHAGIYTEWRHVFFIYPALLLLAVSGILRVWKWIQTFRLGPATVFSWLLIFVIAGEILATGIWMIRNHPLEFAYFSIPYPFVQQHFSAIVNDRNPDYWGLSYREAMQYVLSADPGIVSVYSNENIAFQNAYNPFPQSLTRMMRVPATRDAMFVVVSNPALAQGLPLVHSVTTTDGIFLCGIYRGPVRSVNLDRSTGAVSFERAPVMDAPKGSTAGIQEQEHLPRL
jgi:hypothetical protein